MRPLKRAETNNAPGISFDFARMSDMDDIYDIETRSFPSHWSYDALAVEVRRLRSYSRVLVARQRGRVTGYTVFWLVVDEAHILNFAVHPDRRRERIGERMMRAVFNQARRLRLRRITLEVRVTNHPARLLYEKMGFRTLAVRRRFYEDNGEDAYIMWLDEIPDDDLPQAGQGPLMRRPKTNRPT